MLNKLSHSRSKLLLLACAFALVVVACDDDSDVSPDFERTVTTRWVATGHDIAPLFRGYPLNADSIYLEITEHIPWIYEDSLYFYMYIEKYEADNSLVDIVTGSEGFGAKFIREVIGPDSIVSFVTEDAVDSDGENRVIKGIYKEMNTSDGPELKMEFVYTGNGWPDPPDAEVGFGSTADGAYGDNNIHFFSTYGNSNNYGQ